jgi:hypothetical protein
LIRIQLVKDRHCILSKQAKKREMSRSTPAPFFTSGFFFLYHGRLRGKDDNFVELRQVR